MDLQRGMPNEDWGDYLLSISPSNSRKFLTRFNKQLEKLGCSKDEQSHIFINMTQKSCYASSERLSEKDIKRLSRKHRHERTNMDRKQKDQDKRKVDGTSKETQELNQKHKEKDSHSQDVKRIRNSEDQDVNTKHKSTKVNEKKLEKSSTSENTKSSNHKKLKPSRAGETKSATPEESTKSKECNKAKVVKNSNSERQALKTNTVEDGKTDTASDQPRKSTNIDGEKARTSSSGRKSSSEDKKPRSSNVVDMEQSTSGIGNRLVIEADSTNTQKNHKDRPRHQKSSSTKSHVENRIKFSDRAQPNKAESSLLVDTESSQKDENKQRRKSTSSESNLELKTKPTDKITTELSLFNNKKKSHAEKNDNTLRRKSSSSQSSLEPKTKLMKVSNNNGSKAEDAVLSEQKPHREKHESSSSRSHSDSKTKSMDKGKSHLTEHLLHDDKKNSQKDQNESTLRRKSSSSENCLEPKTKLIKLSSSVDSKTEESVHAERKHRKDKPESSASRCHRESKTKLNPPNSEGSKRKESAHSEQKRHRDKPEASSSRSHSESKTKLTQLSNNSGSKTQESTHLEKKHHSEKHESISSKNHSESNTKMKKVASVQESKYGKEQESSESQHISKHRTKHENKEKPHHTKSQTKQNTKILDPRAKTETLAAVQVFEDPSAQLVDYTRDTPSITQNEYNRIWEECGQTAPRRTQESVWGAEEPALEFPVPLEITYHIITPSVLQGQAEEETIFGSDRETGVISREDALAGIASQEPLDVDIKPDQCETLKEEVNCEEIKPKEEVLFDENRLKEEFIGYNTKEEPTDVLMELVPKNEELSGKVLVPQKNKPKEEPLDYLVELVPPLNEDEFNTVLNVFRPISLKQEQREMLENSCATSDERDHSDTSEREVEPVLQHNTQDTNIEVPSCTSTGSTMKHRNLKHAVNLLKKAQPRVVLKDHSLESINKSNTTNLIKKLKLQAIYLMSLKKFNLTLQAEINSVDDARTEVNENTYSRTRNHQSNPCIPKHMSHFRYHQKDTAASSIASPSGSIPTVINPRCYSNLENASTVANYAHSDSVATVFNPRSYTNLENSETVANYAHSDSVATEINPRSYSNLENAATVANYAPSDFVATVINPRIISNRENALTVANYNPSNRSSLDDTSPSVNHSRSNFKSTTTNNQRNPSNSNDSSANHPSSDIESTISIYSRNTEPAPTTPPFKVPQTRSYRRNKAKWTGRRNEILFEDRNFRRSIELEPSSYASRESRINRLDLQEEYYRRSLEEEYYRHSPEEYYRHVRGYLNSDYRYPNHRY